MRTHLQASGGLRKRDQTDKASGAYEADVEAGDVDVRDVRYPAEVAPERKPLPTTSNRRAQRSLGKRTESDAALTTAAPPRPAWMRTFFEPPTLLLR